jgi:hypothetical protein
MAGDSPYNGINLTHGVRFNFYELEQQNIRKAAVAVSVAGSSTFDHYWEDGPELSGWGDAIAKYPDGTPAVVQGNVGSGWVILAGIHPEAPEDWRSGMNFNTPASVDNEYAAALIEAALNRTRLGARCTRTRGLARQCRARHDAAVRRRALVRVPWQGRRRAADSRLACAGGAPRFGHHRHS